jgi:hypothetical protein
VEEAAGIDLTIHRRGKYLASFFTILDFPSNLAFGKKNTGFKPGFQN